MRRWPDCPAGGRPRSVWRARNGRLVTQPSSFWIFASRASRPPGPITTDHPGEPFLLSLILLRTRWEGGSGASALDFNVKVLSSKLTGLGVISGQIVRVMEDRRPESTPDPFGITLKNWRCSEPLASPRGLLSPARRSMIMFDRPPHLPAVRPT